ncbi:hypothetical protein H2136_19505 [Aeromonas hydrophila]|uniref:Uncharacterized protein n=1 Tax=Aeromonas hydrophila TaxID=644 RepID=A0A926IYC6_AERHY|nr:hypothetical protein [Aeromonas hydrophila]
MTMELTRLRSFLLTLPGAQEDTPSAQRSWSIASPARCLPCWTGRPSRCG